MVRCAARLIAMLVITCLLAVGCSDDPSDLSYRDLLYENLDLSTAEAGAKALADAYDRRDFGTAYLLLDADAQLVVLRYVSSGTQYAEFWQEGTPFLWNDEHVSSIQSFEHRMLLAARAGTLQFDLRGMELGQERAGDTLSDGRSTRLIDATLEDGRSVTLRMTQSPSDRWRLLSMGIDQPPPTADGVVVAVTAVEVADDQDVGGEDVVPVDYPPQSFYGLLPLDTPENAVVTFADLQGSEHYVAASYALSVDAQVTIARSVSNFNLRGFVVESELGGDWFEGILSREHTGVVLPLYEDILRDAGPERLLIDLRGGVEITGTSEIQFEQRDNTLDAVLVEATSPNHPEGLGFVVVQSASGRWRIRQIASPASAAGDPDYLFIADS